MRSVSYCRLVPLQPGADKRGAGPSGAVLGVLFAMLATNEAVGQPVGLFRPATSAAVSAAVGPVVGPDTLTLRRRLVSIDFAQLAPGDPTEPDTPATAATEPGVLRLNLFDDATFTGLVESVASTFSGGYSLSGLLVGVELGTMTLVVNGEVVAGTVRTPGATYRIRPAGGGLHAVSQVDLSRLPPLGEPISRPRRVQDQPPFGAGLGAPPPPR